jgi:hypothetical protein
MAKSRRPRSRRTPGTRGSHHERSTGPAPASWSFHDAAASERSGAFGCHCLHLSRQHRTPVARVTNRGEGKGNETPSHIVTGTKVAEGRLEMEAVANGRDETCYSG